MSTEKPGYKSKATYRRFERLFLYTTAVSIPFFLFFILFAYIYTGDVDFDTIVILVVAILSTIIFFIGLFSLISYRRQKRVNNRKIEGYNRNIIKILGIFDDVFTARTGVSDALFSVLHEDFDAARTRSQVSDYLRVCVERLTEGLQGIECERCAVSIKVLVRDQESARKTVVITLLRDSRSAISRSTVDKRLPAYDVDAHSPFGELIEGRHSKNIFVANDLRSLKGYKNASVDWRSFYNATTIVPICNPDRPPHEDLVGFLCVDSMDASFTKEITGSVIKIISTSIYYAIKASTILLDQLDDAHKKDGDKEMAAV